MVAEHNKLPPSQSGFRKGRTTLHSIAHLTTDIQLGFTANKSTLALFLDIQGAYDSVVLSVLAGKMKDVGIPSHFIMKVLEMVSERVIYLKVNNELIGPRTAKSRLPQGGILSPILYTIYTSDLEHILPEGVKVLQYADDICFYYTSADLVECQNKLSETMTYVTRWCIEKGLKISTEKSVGCLFTRKRPIIRNQLQLDEYVFEVKNFIKFLGIYLDKNLSWSTHINKIREKVENQ